MPPSLKILTPPLRILVSSISREASLLAGILRYVLSAIFNIIINEFPGTADVRSLALTA